MAKKDPNNAYGSAEARQRVLDRVQEDSDRRDHKDRAVAENRARRAGESPAALKEYMRNRKMDSMAASDALKRLNQKELKVGRDLGGTAISGYGLGYIAAERANADEDAPRKRLIKSYATRGYKKGGSVGSASKRGDGIARKGKTKGRFV